MRPLFASTSLGLLVAFASTALAQTAPPAAQPAPGSDSPAAQPTPDVPSPAPTTTAPPATPPPQQPAPTDTVQTPGATTSSSGGSATLAVNAPARTADAERQPARALDPWLDGHALGVEVLFRGGSRLGTGSVASDTEEKAGLGFELGAWFRIARAFSLGLELRRMDLGNLSFTSGQSSVNAGYASTALAIGARVYPFRWSSADLYFGIHAGLAWQDVDANGLRPSVNLEPATVYECSDSAGPGFALGAELGGELRLARAFWLIGNVAGDGYGLTDEKIGNCVSGLGTVTSLSVGIGVLYAFDLGREARVASERAPSPF